MLTRITGIILITLVCCTFFHSAVRAEGIAESRGLRLVAKDPESGQPAEVKLYNKSYAVIIGIDKYPNLPPDKQLSYAVKDAKGVEAVLKKNYKFDRIISLYNEEATQKVIVRLLTTELPKQMGSEDALFLFWAGHGNQESTPEGDIGYLIPYDGSVDDISTTITMSEIRDTISKKIPAKHVFYAMDACYSGLLTTRGFDPKVSRDLAYMKQITKERVRQVLTAGSKGEEVLDGGPRGHSVFTGRLIEILEQIEDYKTANEIQAILKRQVYNDAAGRGHSQTPGFGALSGNGDFVFIPNIQQRVADLRAEIEKIQRDKEELEAQEAAALKASDDRRQREAEQARKSVEARLKAAQLKEQQLAEEERKRAEDEQERLRLVAQKSEDEQRLAKLRVELEKKRQQVQLVVDAETLDATVAEIKRLSARIDEIEATYEKELIVTRQKLKERYEAKLTALDQEKRDEFESSGEFANRINRERGKLKSLQETELAALATATAAAAETTPLKEAIRTLAEKEFKVGAEAIAVDLGQYNADSLFFPVSLQSKSPSIQLAVHGKIPLSRDQAKTFKQQYLAGAVRPQVAIKAGSGAIKSVKLFNDASNDMYEYVSDEFLTPSEQRLRITERQLAKAREARQQEEKAKLQRERQEKARQEEEDRRLAIQCQGLQFIGGGTKECKEYFLRKENRASQEASKSVKVNTDRLQKTDGQQPSYLKGSRIRPGDIKEVFNFKNWFLTQSRRGDIYLWHRDNNLSVELIKESSGWWRLSQSGSEHTVFSSSNKIEGQLYLRPWQENLPSATKLSDWSYQIEGKHGSHQIHVDDDTLSITMPDKGRMSIDLDSALVLYTDKNGRTAKYE